jgi:hypothetical protein
VKLLIASALIAVMPVMAMGQKMIPDKCNNLHVTYDAMDVDQYSKNLYINAATHNDDQYALTNATFYFDLLIDDNVKVGEAAQSIGGLLSGEVYKVRIFTSVKEIKSIRIARVSCHFSE